MAETLVQQFRRAVQQREAVHARDSLADYAKLLFPPYQLAAHHRLLINELEAVERGETGRLMIF